MSQPQPTPIIVCYGELVTDLIVTIQQLPVLAEQMQPIRSISVEPGGSGNFLITAARLGAQAVALGTVGEDGYGQDVSDMLSTENIDMRYTQRGVGSVNGLVMVMVDDAGQHVFLVRGGVGDAFVMDDGARECVQTADAFFVPGYALHQRRVGPAAVQTARMAHAAGVPVMSDLGPIVRDVRVHVRTAALDMVQLSTVSLLTADEATLFSGENNYVDAAHWMLAHGTPQVVIKRGADGCAVFGADGLQFDIPGIPVPVRDTTAAGDAFAAGFVVEWLKHRDARRAAMFANCVGAAKVQKIGSGRQCPTLAEIEAVQRLAARLTSG